MQTTSRGLSLYRGEVGPGRQAIRSGVPWSPPEDAGGVFDALADHGVIDRTLADSMHAAVGLRKAWSQAPPHLQQREPLLRY